MIGVVVWSNPERQKAVIWCDDQGALAYLEGPEHLMTGTSWPSAGDLLELDSETVGDLRHARAVTLLNPRHCPELPQILRNGATDEAPLRLVASNGRRVDQPAESGSHQSGADRLLRMAVCGG